MPYHYLGCYRDDATRDLQTYLGEGYDITTCWEACQDFPYFALQIGRECRCDYDFGDPVASYPRIDDAECDLHGLTKYMGGPWANAVFRNEGYFSRPVVDPSFPAWPGLHTPND
jgi:hypothetical protein